MDKTVRLELELVPLADEMEHPFSYFKEELEEFFEQFGWKVLKTNIEEE